MKERVFFRLIHTGISIYLFSFVTTKDFVVDNGNRSRTIIKTITYEEPTEEDYLHFENIHYEVITPTA